MLGPRIQLEQLDTAVLLHRSKINMNARKEFHIQICILSLMFKLVQETISYLKYNLSKRIGIAISGNLII